MDLDSLNLEVDRRRRIIQESVDQLDNRVKKGGKSPMVKGRRFEQNVVNIAKNAGHIAKRTPMSKKPDIMLDGHPVSCKRRKSSFGWMYQELEDHDMILCRDDNREILQIKKWRP